MTGNVEQQTQLKLNFSAGRVDSYDTCREYVNARSHQIGRLQKHIAADMDLSPSVLSRKLAQNPSDTHRFTLDDLEKYIQTTGDVEPVYYLVERYLLKKSEDDIRKQIEELQRQLDSAA